MTGIHRVKLKQMATCRRIIGENRNITSSTSNHTCLGKSILLIWKRWAVLICIPHCNGLNQKSEFVFVFLH